VLKHEKNTATNEAQGFATLPATSKPTPRFLKPKDAAAHIGIGRSKLYEMMDGGQVKSAKLGGARLVDMESLLGYVLSLTK
jgi:predicted DNA-binding transcriptional regulator AlpA